MLSYIRIIQAHDFITATPDGQFDFEKSKELLIEIASASVSMGDYELILDTRKSQIEMSISDLWHLAAELSKFRKAFGRKIAVLCPLEGFDHAGFFALCAENRGYRVKAFTSFEDAIEWLFANES
ncbi:MAG: hypothetical protein P4L50_19625 [Anaerolineaceae bacterium]|nr:hypothetical protein [Anaerolineaceae bacterium]